MPHETNECHEHESSQYMMTKCLLNENKSWKGYIYEFSVFKIKSKLKKKI